MKKILYYTRKRQADNHQTEENLNDNKNDNHENHENHNNVNNKIKNTNNTNNTNNNTNNNLNINNTNINNNTNTFDIKIETKNSISQYINIFEKINNNLSKINIDDFKYLNTLKNNLIDTLNNIKKIIKDKNINSNILIICHVSDIDIFNKIYEKYKNFFIRENVLFYITVHESYHQDIIKRLLPNSFIDVIDRKGNYIGGYLKTIKNILKSKLNDNLEYVYFLHTCICKDNIEQIFSGLCNNYVEIEKKYNEYESSFIIGNDINKQLNNIGKNINKLREFYNKYNLIFKKYNVNTLDNFNDYFNSYYPEYYINNGKNILNFDIEYYKSIDKNFK